jgi:tripartite-type tricarboxylate transporter receptor subunit TctC
MGIKMKARIHNGIICALAVLLAALSAGNARAQSDYPNKPIHFIVGFAAGGGNDLFARLVV